MSRTFDYDLAIVGAGAAGLSAAVRASTFKFKTLLIEEKASFATGFFNIEALGFSAISPSDFCRFIKNGKLSELLSEHALHALPNSKLPDSKLFSQEVDASGAELKDQRSDISGLVDKEVSKLLSSTKVEFCHATASFYDEHTLFLESGSAKKKITAEYIILATGSKQKTLGFLPSIKEFDAKQKAVFILGAGFSGLEMAQQYASLGLKVTLADAKEKILASMDAELAEQIISRLKSQGVEFLAKRKAVSLEYSKTGREPYCQLNFATRAGKKTTRLSFKLGHVGNIQLAVGRRPKAHALFSEKVGIVRDELGRIPVNRYLQTIHMHIYALGDVIGGQMSLAKSYAEAAYCVERIRAIKQEQTIFYPMGYRHIPLLFFTRPGVCNLASIGANYKEELFRQENIPYKVKSHSFPSLKFLGLASKSSEKEAGFIKLLWHNKKGDTYLLGVHLVGFGLGKIFPRLLSAAENYEPLDAIRSWANNQASDPWLEALKKVLP